MEGKEGDGETRSRHDPPRLGGKVGRILGVQRRAGPPREKEHRLGQLSPGYPRREGVHHSEVPGVVQSPEGYGHPDGNYPGD